jgi:hypothetical protein
MVYTKDEYCCNCGWDNICANLYWKFLNPGLNVDDTAYRIDNQIQKPLLLKLMSNETFKNRYFDVFKYILDSIFIPEQIYQSIIQNTDLIREAVYADTNYMYSTEYFEHDINTICSSTDVVTSLNRMLEKRKMGLAEEFASLNYTAKPVEQAIDVNDIVINELKSNNDSLIDNKSDWIELYNNTNSILSLSNLTLSDTSDNKYKWEFPDNVAIMPDGYVIVWADEKKKKNNLHANFKLAADGEELFLTHKKFGTIDSVTFGAQPINKSFARLPNGTGPFTLLNPTFDRENVDLPVVNRIIDIKGEITYIIYPNPADEYVIIQSFMENIDYSIIIYNLNGQLIKNQTSEGNMSATEVKGIAEGLYIVELVSEGKTERYKLVVNH